MNNTSCPHCQQKYSFSNPPKKLKNCEHNICDSCLPTAVKCPFDQKKVDFRRFTARAFQINHQLLDTIQQQNQSPKKVKPTVPKQSSPKKSYEVCLLHSKAADLICCIDENLICASCALFGEHKGHTIRNCDQFLNQLTNYTEQALQVFDKLKQKEDNLNSQIVNSYIDDCFKQQKQKEVKSIKQGFIKLMDKVKKAQKVALARLDSQINYRKQQLIKQASINELQGKKNEWYKQVQTLGNVTQEAYLFKSIGSALRYLDEKSSQSFLLKRGEYLHLQYTSSQDVIKNKIDTETAKLTALFSQQIDKAIDQYVTFAGSTQRSQNTPCTRLKQSNISRIQRNTQDDILIQQVSALSDLSNSGIRKQTLLKPEIDNKSGYVIGIKIPEVSIIQSIQPANQQYQTKQKSEKMLRSRSFRTKSTNELTTSVNRQVLGTIENKKKRKIQIPEKYKQVFEDLKNDRSEVIDFGGAQLGDQNVLGLCQYIQKTNKLRNLKLVRNKISDDVLKQLLNACFCAKVTSLNLGQNQLTEKTLQMLETFDLGELRNITLSLNKINRRNVKTRLDDFVKRGITLSI